MAIVDLYWIRCWGGRIDDDGGVILGNDNVARRGVGATNLKWLLRPTRGDVALLMGVTVLVAVMMIIEMMGVSS